MSLVRHGEFVPVVGGPMVCPSGRVAATTLGVVKRKEHENGFYARGAKR
jgi:hypothetical protein